MNTNPNAITILCYGDSNTWGQKPDESERYPANVRWTGLLQIALGGDYYVIEEGLSSRTTDLEYNSSKPDRNGKAYLEPCVDSHLPIDIVILMLGTNDLKIEFHRSPREVAEAIEGLVGIIKAKTTYQRERPAHIILVSPIHIDDTQPRFEKLYVPDYYDHESVVKSQQLARELQSVADKLDCTFVDAAQIASAGDDGLHFSQEAHTALSNILIETLRSHS